MNYDEIKSKYKDVEAQRRATLNTLTEKMQTKRREEERILRELNNELSGRYDYEASERVQTLRFELKEAQAETAKAQAEIDKFNGGDTVASVVEDMKL